MSREAYIKKCESTIVSRILQNYDADLYWKSDVDGSLQKSAIHSRFPYSRFACKPGLLAVMEEMEWFVEPNISFARFPRCYNPSIPEHLEAFKDDFRLTACMSLLKNFIKALENMQPGISTNLVPGSVVQFAIDRCREFIAKKHHLDLDRNFTKPKVEDWEKFLGAFYIFVHKQKRFKSTRLQSVGELKRNAVIVLKELVREWPQYDLDGMMNIWVIKPGYNCRGRGIRLMNNLSLILTYATPQNNSRIKYVIQKYLERPLLIYDTKFDIRQWFLVTSVAPLIIWMYKDCYLRFSTQKFSLTNYHEAVHLTNNAVQRRYKPQTNRHEELPRCNMWDSRTFREFLSEIGHPEKWGDIIYPGMRQGIVGAMLASQEHMIHRPNSFQLYGADFILDATFAPWLLEINSCPDMGNSTDVTAKLCPQCLEDVIKVVIDRRSNREAGTGKFELIYKQDQPKLLNLEIDLTIEGKRVKRFSPPTVKKLAEKGSGERSGSTVQPPKVAPPISKEKVVVTDSGEVYYSRGTDCELKDEGPPVEPNETLSIIDVDALNKKLEETIDLDVETADTPLEYNGPVIADLISVLQAKVSDVTFVKTNDHEHYETVAPNQVPPVKSTRASPTDSQRISTGVNVKQNNVACETEIVGRSADKNKKNNETMDLKTSPPTDLQVKPKSKDLKQKKKKVAEKRNDSEEKVVTELQVKSPRVNAGTQYYILDTFLKRKEFLAVIKREIAVQTN